jgi:hypothetical protein
MNWKFKRQVLGAALVASAAFFATEASAQVALSNSMNSTFNSPTGMSQT